jgi:hypothetical protein
MKIVNHMQMAYYPVGTIFAEYDHCYGIQGLLQVLTSREDVENEAYPTFFARDAIKQDDGEIDWDTMTGDYPALGIPAAHSSTKYSSCNDDMYMIVDHDYVDQLAKLLRYQLDNVVEVLP